MKAGLMAGLVVAALVASGILAISLPSALSSFFGTSRGSGIPFECEELVDGDRVEVRDETEDEKTEIRVDADTRVRAEARFEVSDGSEIRREARVDFCGVVHFIDEDGDGSLSAADTIVRSDLVAFGAIDHRLTDDMHSFEATSDEGNMTVAIRIPSSLPVAEVSLIGWTIVADPLCDAEATRFAVKVEREEPDDRDEFFASACGTKLSISGDDGSSGAPVPQPGEFECEDRLEGNEFAFGLSERTGSDERSLQGRVEADSRVRAEVRFDTESSRDWASDQDTREARIDLCGVLQFVDQDGDGEFGSADMIVSKALVGFATLVHRLDGGFHVFEARSAEGNLIVTIRAPATFPLTDEPLLAWSVEAGPICDPDATHFAVKLKQDAPSAADRFFAAECGTTLFVAGDLG